MDGRNKRNQRGSMELVASILVLVPIALFLVDVAGLVIASNVNDEIVKRAARSAAGQPTRMAASQAVLEVKDQFSQNGLIKKIERLEIVEYDTAGGGGVRVRSRIVARLPVPVPLVKGNGAVFFQAEAQEPIVALEAPAERV